MGEGQSGPQSGAKTGALLAALATILLLAAAAPANAVVLYDQYNNAATTPPGRITSQDFEAALDSSDAQAADDFVVPAGQTWNVTGVDVDGDYADGPGPADSVHVYFYANGAANLPGSLVASRPANTYTGSGGDFSISLTSPVALPSATYWVSVQAREDHVPAGRWYWHNRTVQSNSGAAWQNPGNGYGYGCTSWTRVPACAGLGNPNPDMVFRINGTLGNPQQPTLTATKDGSGSGTMTSDPAGIDCGASCSHAYDQGTAVTLTANADAGSSFAGWSGSGCSGAATCAVTIDADKTVTATFTANGSAPTPPDTEITKAKIGKKKHKAKFEFTGSGGAPPLSFECKLDDKEFEPCSPPSSYKHLKPGKHTFQVRAKDAGGRLDPTPATQDFKIKRKRR